jgi:ABC-type transporter Mla MlaB component
VAAPGRSSTLVLSIGGSLSRADIEPMCRRARALLQGGPACVLICDLRGLVTSDAVVVEALARLQLTARSLGCHVELRNACGELRDLLLLTGLADVLPECEDLPLEPRRQPEEGEPPPGVEEERDPADPVA